MSERDRGRRVRAPDPAADVETELAFHLEMRVQELEARGVPRAEAEAQALRRLGDVERSRRECVEIGERRNRNRARTEYMAELKQDLFYALRMLRRAPGFTLVAVVTLALGIGANSAIFSVVHGVLLRSLPYPAADQLYAVSMIYPDGTEYLSLSAPDFMSVREDVRALAGVEAYSSGTFTLLGAGEPREVRGASVSDGLFELLGMRMAFGRGFSLSEMVPGQGMVTVLDHGFWQREFGGERDVLGTSVRVGGDVYTVIGVLAPDARLPHPTDMYAPLEYGETFSATTAAGRRGEYLSVLGRATRGSDAAQVRSDLARVGMQLQTAFPDTNERLTMGATPLRDVIIGDVQRPLLILLGAVGFVLLVACANVANLLLARASARQSELAVRAALGAGRGRLLRQLLTESLVLALAGGVAGLGIAYWGTHALVAAQPADIPRLDEVGLSGAVVLFTLVAALFTGVMFGMVPALQATGGRLMRAIREGGRGAGQGSGGNRIRASLVVAELALAVVLLTGAGLLIRSFLELTRVQPGFETENAMTFRLTLQGDAYGTGQQLRDRVELMTERLQALPGVVSVGAATTLPLSGLGSVLNFAVAGAPLPPDDVNREIGVASITPDYLRAIGTPLVRGRVFTAQDRQDAPPVALINEAGARFWFPNEDPIGRRVVVGASEPEIVGVVKDVLQRDPGQAAVPYLLIPYAQRTTRTVRVVVRAAGDPLVLAPAIRAEVQALDPEVPLNEFTPLRQLLSASVARPRFYTSLLSLFAAVALVLAAIGIFGVMSYTVAQRAREISIRMALGAHAGQVVRMVVGRAMALALLGVAVGLVAAAALGQVLQSQLYGVGVLDPLTISAVVLMLSGCAALASWLPARRAAAVEPGGALRES